ncbi:MAG: DUF1570 domain-containing protein [Planctomycetota bacterium]|nr:DUF1570 domain-containing protein [Planctomycetota bacterium]
MTRPVRLLVVLVLLIGVIPGSLRLEDTIFAQVSSPATSAALPASTKDTDDLDLNSAAQWSLEHVVLHDGRRLSGILRTADDESVVLVEVRRPKGRPMFLVVRRFPRSQVQRIEELSAAEKTQLAQRIAKFRNREADDSQSLAGLALVAGSNAEGPSWIYEQGPWFKLESWTDEEMTRRAILRMEQAFSAYGELLPVRVKPVAPLRIQLFGSMQQYQQQLQRQDLRISNPAIFNATQNVLIAGSELSEFARQLKEVRNKNQQIRKKYAQLSAEAPRRMQHLVKELEAAGVSATERKATVQAAQRQWEQELSAVNRKLAILERENTAQFDRVTREMFARLGHEAFHAYLGNFVFPSKQYDIPRWLNEGLAQVFEDGILEVGTLRLDSPDKQRLRRLQDDLQKQPRLPLEELLAARSDAFLVAHSNSAEASQRYYLYSWGLAYYLAVQEPKLTLRALTEYFQRDPSFSSVARFEKLVGMPLAEFEPKWRKAMLAMSVEK